MKKLLRSAILSGVCILLSACGTIATKDNTTTTDKAMDDHSDIRIAIMEKDALKPGTMSKLYQMMRDPETVRTCADDLANNGAADTGTNGWLLRKRLMSEENIANRALKSFAVVLGEKHRSRGSDFLKSFARQNGLTIDRNFNVSLGQELEPGTLPLVGFCVAVGTLEDAEKTANERGMTVALPSEVTISDGCNESSGQATLTQTGRFFEIEKDDTIQFFGIAGAGSVAMLANTPIIMSNSDSVLLTIEDDWAQSATMSRTDINYIDASRLGNLCSKTTKITS